MSFCIVVPCYNEANRFPTEQFRHFLKKNLLVKIVFVDDGSTDNTLDVLSDIEASFSSQVEVLTLEKNQGKASAVQQGLLAAFTSYPSKKYAYLDADLSTSLEECTSLSHHINDTIKFVFGSRIMKTDNQIERKWYRFIIGRFIASIISKMLGIPVYDTQCGCKIIDSSLVKSTFTAHFTSRWLFDVEIFFRLINVMGKEQMLASIKEVPLEKWIDTDDSRVEFSYMFNLWLDLTAIYKRYKQ
ncbi:MAG: glycosyltransferase [Flavobacteriaceae bacterium]